uniref:Uncharacterized protein n=1 Tax=Yersinia enterocolitica TaxID=630 RepID=B0RKP0_YEREN|nr:hypothetical protein [Yersinia enterocolitica]
MKTAVINWVFMWVFSTVMLMYRAKPFTPRMPSLEATSSILTLQVYTGVIQQPRAGTQTPLYNWPGILDR